MDLGQECLLQGYALASFFVHLSFEPFDLLGVQFRLSDGIGVEPLSVLVLLLKLLDVVSGLDETLFVVLKLLHQIVFGAFQISHLPQEVFLASGAGPSVLLDLFLQETDFLLVEIALPGQLFDPPLVLASLFYLGVQNLFELANLSFVLKTLPALLVEFLFNQLNLLVVTKQTIVPFMESSSLLRNHCFELLDHRYIRHGLPAFLVNLSLQHLDFILVQIGLSSQLQDLLFLRVGKLELFLQHLLQLLDLGLVGHALPAFVFNLVPKDLDFVHVAAFVVLSELDLLGDELLQPFDGGFVGHALAALLIEFGHQEVELLGVEFTLPDFL